MIINDMVQDIVEYEAKKLSRTNRSVGYGDLVQEGLLPMLDDKVKNGQKKAYYKRIAFNAMLDWIREERGRGIVVNEHGGDRKSGEFRQQRPLMGNFHVVSLDGLPTEISDTPLHFSSKTSVPDYDDYTYPLFSGDRITERWLRGGGV